MTSTRTALLSLALPLLLATSAEARSICRDAYGRQYYCSGLGYGARIGIGIGVAAGVLLLFSLCGIWKRRQIRRQFSHYKPPALPYSNNNNTNTEAQYANNPPPPSSFNGNNPYGSNPPPPPQTYQPSAAGQYGRSNTAVNTGASAGVGAGEHEHGYEWEQAREQERLERENANANGGHGGAATGGDLPPPIYEVATSAHNTGSAANSAHYQPPPGPPPGKQAHAAV